MKCPYCHSDDTQVKDSRATNDATVIRRRRACNVCMARFTTFERVQLREVSILKQNGEIEPFNYDKLLRSIELATRKRAITSERIERIVSSIQRQIEDLSEHPVSSDRIGELVMGALQHLDQVSYVRFASVYRNFHEARDFEVFIADEFHDDQAKNKTNKTSPSRKKTPQKKTPQLARHNRADQNPVEQNLINIKPANKPVKATKKIANKTKKTDKKTTKSKIK